MPTNDNLKRAIATTAFAPFRQGVAILDKDAKRVDYTVATYSELAMGVTIHDHTGRGPRLFEVRVKEVL